MKLEKGRGSRIKTLGEVYLETQKEAPHAISVNELGQEILQGNESYMKALWRTIENGLDVLGIPVVFVELHKWMDRAINRPQMRRRARASCPTPTYGQDAWKYDKRIGKLECLWSMPDRESSIAYVQNTKIVPKEEQKSMLTVLNFYNGSLDALCKIEQDAQDKVIMMFYGDDRITH